jgi:hypothetical protein
MRLCCVLSAEGLGGVRSKLPPAKANAGDVILATTIAAASMSFVLLNMGASPYRPGKALLPKNGAGSAPDNGVLVEWIVREM